MYTNEVGVQPVVAPVPVAPVPVAPAPTHAPTNCLICLEIVELSVGQKCGECIYWYHRTCIEGWYRSSGARACPSCRRQQPRRPSLQNTTKIAIPGDEAIIEKIECYICQPPRFGLAEFRYRCCALMYLKSLIRNGRSYIAGSEERYIYAVDYAKGLLRDPKFIKCWFSNEAKAIVEEYCQEQSPDFDG